MPYERPGQGYYATATKETGHNEPCIENGVSGAAVKQRAGAESWKEGLDTTPTIAVGEKFHIRTKGIKQFSTAAGSKGAALAAATKGAAVYITEATNALALAGGAGLQPFGRVVEIPGSDDRGVPTGFVRIDLDLKDTVA